jgi:alkane 1-monooxygenase
MIQSAEVKLAGFALAIIIPMLAPVAFTVGYPWLAPGIVFCVLPFLSLVIGEDHSLPLIGLRQDPVRLSYLHALPRLYGCTWILCLLWAASYAARTDLTAAQFAALTLSVGIASALAIPTAHELLHRRAPLDTMLARLMTVLCLYGHMLTEHLHHHAKVGSSQYGSTAPRGMSVYRFMIADFAQGLRNAWSVESVRIKRCHERWWQHQVIQGYAAACYLGCFFAIAWGPAGLLLFVGQAVFAVVVFEIITYLHHYGLVLEEGEELGPQHAWAHHCWLTNCLTFNNTFHGDHHLRPGTPYYELHAMYEAPRLPASYVTMFWVALVPPLWYRLIHPRLDALDKARREAQQSPEWLRVQVCR